MGGVTFQNGLLPFGYLGVDVFFVISGYFLIKSLFYSFVNNSFDYFKFIFRKIIRLWPLVLLVSGISIIIGFFFMLPDDYENLAESVVASVLFSNNILACITTKNYWDIVNLYKPLMHLWYIGVLMKAYIILPLFYMLILYFNRKNVKRSMMVGTIVLTVASLLLFLMPFSTAWKFYYLPFRLFEITIGGLVFFCTRILPEQVRRIVFWGAVILLLCMLISREVLINKSLMLLVVVFATSILIFCSDIISASGVFLPFINAIMFIGERSYSIYIWHQFVIAFLFYSVFYKLDIVGFPVFLILTMVLSLFSYHYIEKQLESVIDHKHKEWFVTIYSMVVSVILCGLSLWVFFHAGVVRDVPELDIEKNNVHRHMHAEYCDRPYKWDKNFSRTGVPRVLVLGNSFGRDWANILYEYDKNLDISYVYYTEKGFLERLERIKIADRVFYAMGPGYGSVPEIITKNVLPQKLFIIGNKNYGESNGIIYARKGSDNYYSQSVNVPLKLKEQNQVEASHWSSHYVDMLAPVTNAEGKIHVFTDDKKFISQDCRHLTEAGAKYYARILNIKDLLVFK